MIVIQKSFSDGLDLLSSDTQISENGYSWLINARNRFGVIDPILKHLEVTAPSGIKQGCRGLGDTLIIFVAGKAYYLLNGSDTWIQIPSFQMKVDAPIIWNEAVPASTFSFLRKLNSSGNINDKLAISADAKINGTPACVVCQDGTNRPWLIIWDDVNDIFTARQAGTYDTWTNVDDSGADREYVPIGKQMMYKDGKLYIVSPDGKSLYHSITGRPLDFMVNVDTNGNKLPSENNGGATTVSFAFDFDEITCIQPIDIADSFIYGTAKNSRIITLDFTNPIFGEPQFRCAAKLNCGIANQYSFADALNDFVCIDQGGVKSFNAVQQVKIKGNSSIFSLQLSKLLFNAKDNKQIKQRHCSIIAYNSYLLFNLDTYWGNLFAVYDLLRAGWVALDITKVFRVKQYAYVETASEVKLYCVTENDKVFQMFAGPNREVAQLRVKGFVTPETNVEQKSQFVRCMFEGGTYDGLAELIEYVDDQESTNTRSSKDLKVQIGAIAYPVRPPVMPHTEQRIENTSFPLPNGLTGKKINFILQWTNDAKLIEFELVTSETQNAASYREQNLTQKSTYGTPTSN